MFFIDIFFERTFHKGIQEKREISYVGTYFFVLTKTYTLRNVARLKLYYHTVSQNYIVFVIIVLL